MKVSIIIPSYNSSEYIIQALNSILKQTYCNYEIIIIDGSTDNTSQVIKKFTDIYPDKIRFFYQQPSGVSAARNKGIKNAQGDYIAFLDSDDTWLPQKLEWQVSLLESNPDVALIYSDGEMFDNSGSTLITSLSHPLTKYHVEEFDHPESFRAKILNALVNDGIVVKGYACQDLLLYNFVFTSSVVIRKKELEEIGYFDESFKLAEDYDLWLRMSQKYPFIFLNRITARYRYREDGLSGDMGIRNSRYNEYKGKLFEKFLMSSSNDLKPKIIKKIYVNYRKASWGYLNSVNIKHMRYCVKKSLQYNSFQPKLYFYIFISFIPIFIKIVLRLRKVFVWHK